MSTADLKKKKNHVSHVQFEEQEFIILPTVGIINKFAYMDNCVFFIQTTQSYFSRIHHVFKKNHH